MRAVGPTRYEDYEGFNKNRIDQKLANLLMGDHPIEGNEETRVVMLEELFILEKATMDAGDARHTGDWDWIGKVTLKDGEVIEDCYSIGFADRPDNFLACVDWSKVTHVELDGTNFSSDFDENAVDFNRHVHINQITNIRWEV